MSEICSKTKSCPSLIKQKLISTPLHIMIILRLQTPPPLTPLEKSLLPLTPSDLVYLFTSSGTNITSNDSSTYVEESFEELSESRDSELVSSSHELGDSSSSSASLALRFPRAWGRTRSINSALLPLILRPSCFRYI